MPVDPTNYKGISLEQLRIEGIQWDEAAIDHIRTRSTRREGDFDIEPEWATEAALDPHRVIRASGDRVETASVKVVGYSRSALDRGRLLKVWIWSDEPTDAFGWNGGSACVANQTDERRYEQGG